MAISSRQFPQTHVLFIEHLKDAAVTADRFTGAWAPVNSNDFVLFASHGEHPNSTDGGLGCPCRDYPWGPRLGCWRDPACSQAYDITWHTDAEFGYAGWGYLKWAQWFACATLFRSDPLGYYSDMFEGLHALMGFRSLLPEPQNASEAQLLSEAFWMYWKDFGFSLAYAWAYSINWVYMTRQQIDGIAPAVLGSTQGYAYETWASAGDEAAPDGASYYT
ncbi:MAG: hypothetical protein GF331_26265 [Chitinivibrionales bacterium]|nr:hypothetical protein [Chitinivibrionales bacterium]